MDLSNCMRSTDFGKRILIVPSGRSSCAASPLWVYPWKQGELDQRSEDVRRGNAAPARRRADAEMHCENRRSGVRVARARNRRARGENDLDRRGSAIRSTSRHPRFSTLL